MFSCLANAILGLLRGEIVRNICFHIEYNISDLSAVWPGENPKLEFGFPVSP